MLQNDIYAGYVACGDITSDTPSSLFPHVWDEATHRAIVQERARRYRGYNAPTTPAGGIVICARCGWRMQSYVPKRRNRIRYYRCRKHAAKLITGEPCQPNTIRADHILDEPATGGS